MDRHYLPRIQVHPVHPEFTRDIAVALMVHKHQLPGDLHKVQGAHHHPGQRPGQLGSHGHPWRVASAGFHHHDSTIHGAVEAASEGHGLQETSAAINHRPLQVAWLAYNNRLDPFETDRDGVIGSKAGAG